MITSKGSKSFKRTQNHRENYINWSIKQLNLKNYKEIKLENIKDLRRYKKCSRFMLCWVYSKIFEKIELECKKEGVLISYKNPTYTSQRCSNCGWTLKKNRKGKLFCCTSCGFKEDADKNASNNILLDLTEITVKERLLNKNRVGFYFYEKGQELIVPGAQENFKISSVT